MTVSEPMVATFAAGSVTASCVELMYVVSSATPLTSTTDAGTKFVPVKVSGSAGPPSWPDDGLSDVSVGGALLTTNDALPVLCVVRLSVTVTLCGPAASTMLVKVCWPLSLVGSGGSGGLLVVNVYGAGRVAPGSLLVTEILPA